MEEFKKDLKRDEINPYDKANILSWLSFYWLLPLCIKGYKKELTEDDIYQHRQNHDSAKLGDKLEKNWMKELAKKKSPSFFKALSTTFLTEVAILHLVIILHEVLRIFQPFLVTKLILIFDDDKASEAKNEVYFCAGFLILISAITANMSHNFNFALMQVGMKIRVAACSLIYRKTLKLSKSALAETTIGQMVNLMTNDVARFDNGIHSFHNLYLGPIELIIVMILLYVKCGWTTLSGALLFFIFIPFQSWLGKKASEFRLKTATKTDERVRLMNEIISGILIIKMYTWEKPLSKLIKIVRSEEMHYIRKTAVIRAILKSGILMLNKMAVAVCVLAYVLTGNRITATYAYTVTSYFKILYTLTDFFPLAAQHYSEMFISIQRIQKFLLYNEINSEENCNIEKWQAISENGDRIIQREENGKIGLHIKNVSAKWISSLPENTLEDINIDIISENIAALIGPVGSGKTTLLHVIMKELELQSGFVNVKGTISYASQEPWVFGGSIRQNILFGQKYDENRYEEVIKHCALQTDLALFPHGDRTIVGDRGITLSGGQKARVGLARAIYQEADIYLLDDPLSAVDAQVGKHIFEKCICSYLRKKCVLLVTHQIHYLNKIENIYLMNGGKIEIAGSYTYLERSKNIFGKIFTEIEEKEDINKMIPMDVSKTYNNKKQDENIQVQMLKKEEKFSGNISNHVYFNLIKSGGKWTVLGLIVIFVFSQVFESLMEYYVTFWVNIQHINFLKSNYCQSINNSILQICPKIEEQYQYQGWWLTPLFTSNNTVIYYSFLMILLATTVLIKCLAFFKWCLTVSTTLHNKMFSNIVLSQMVFFNLNPCGRILNRFSNDIGVIDELLPLALLDTMQLTLFIVSCAFVIGSLTIWISIPTVIIGILCYMLRRFYSKTGRNIKRIESITRSPIFTHLSATLQGLTTIRAFKAQEILKSEFDNYQNLNTAAFFLYVGGGRGFGFWLDFLCVVYIALVLAALLFLKNETLGGNMGLALSQSMSLTGLLQYGLRQWNEFENRMTSVERIQEYAELKQEKDDYAGEPDGKWPSKGTIEFRNTYLRYDLEEPFVLKNINCIIRPKEKIGVVGRTGAGKSSLIQALFRLAHINGSIIIDGIDTKTIPLRQLRSKISIIPQDPILFSGTLRNNLDPFNEYEDEILWNALKCVELKQAVDELQTGLESKIAEGGSNFSIGQKQLFCLARAIIRKNKILVLDEATSNVDPKTDNLIQLTIRKNFKNCTILTVAHRLHTIMDSDKILVMDNGEAVQFDHPHILLQNKNGVFYSLVQNTGKATARNLICIAKENYKNRPDIFTF